MSREIIFYADKRRNPDTRIALYWIGADAAEVLFKSLSDLSYRNNAGYIEIGKAAREMREGLDAEIEKCTDMIKEYQGFIAEYHHALINVPSVEIYHEISYSIQEYKREIKEVEDDIEVIARMFG
jgi:hypothetical protein